MRELILEQCIQWTAEIPGDRCLLSDSPNFTFQDCECHFSLISSPFGIADYQYSLFINSEHTLSPPFDGTVYIVDGTDSFSCGRKTVSDDYHPIWERSESEILKHIPDFDTRQSLCLRVIAHADAGCIHSQVSSERKVVGAATSSKNSPCLDSLLNDLQRLAVDESQHDVKLTCGDQVITAHKAILSARSSVFRAMLESDMRERRTGTVEVQDMEFPVLQMFLKYIYAGTLPELTPELARQLFEAGDKYAVDALRSRCAPFLKGHLTLDNACETLTLAEAHSDQGLKESVISYMIDQEIPKRYKGWSKFCESHPKLAIEVLNLCVLRN